MCPIVPHSAWIIGPEYNLSYSAEPMLAPRPLIPRTDSFNSGTNGAPSWEKDPTTMNDAVIAWT